MALKAQSMFLYGLEVTANNSSLDFKNSSGGSVLMATLTQGFYSLGGLATEIIKQLQFADPTNTYSVTVDRTIAGGTQNRLSISTSGAFLSLLFGSGPRSASTVAPLIGFTSIDHTGSTSYVGATSCGTILTTEKEGFNYLPVEMDQLIYGNVNVSANGTKEAVVFQIQQFWSVEFRYEPEAKVKTEWLNLNQWMIQQRFFEFTPEITSPTAFYEGTLEKSQKDGKGLGFQFKEMLPNFPFEYQSGPMVFRLNTA